MLALLAVAVAAHAEEPQAMQDSIPVATIEPVIEPAAEPVSEPEDSVQSNVPQGAKDSMPAIKVPKREVYQGTTVRIDLLNPILDLARSGWRTYDIEAAVNVRLIDWLFPTIEFGHAARFLQEKNAAVPLYDGWGEFARLGLDINPLKKRRESRSVLLIGVRAGTGWQNMHTPAVLVEHPKGVWIADAWGEIVAGVQVNIVKGFNMGWAVRMKYLFTQNSHDELTIPYYIPGFGYRDTMSWGFNYYVGYTF